MGACKSVVPLLLEWSGEAEAAYDESPELYEENDIGEGTSKRPKYRTPSEEQGPGEGTSKGAQIHGQNRSRATSRVSWTSEDSKAVKKKFQKVINSMDTGNKCYMRSIKERRKFLQECNIECLQDFRTPLKLEKLKTKIFNEMKKNRMKVASQYERIEKSPIRTREDTEDSQDD